ncbi:unnamed protein product [Meganyctiphanes norvegica]|uniref:G-protein coupled receptors family 1 profile domain-containing protein n=1 Tax=Meganyctiphanes norvegica TaxID=48144 RepID=A0AAV2R083_MEGNR
MRSKENLAKNTIFHVTHGLGGVQSTSKNITTVLLSMIIDQVEVIELKDVAQLFNEVLLTLLSLVGNGLVIAILWKVARKHPAQALRVSLAIAALLVCVTRSGLAVVDHSYFLWCAVQPERCQVQVDFVTYGNARYISRGGFYVIAFIVYHTSFGCNNVLIVIMAVDRFVAICNPLRYRTIITMGRVCIAILCSVLLLFCYTCVIIMLDQTIPWKVTYNTVNKTNSIVFTNKTVLLIDSIISISFIIISLILLIVLAGVTIHRIVINKKKITVLTESTLKPHLDKHELEITITLILAMVFFFVILLIIIILSINLTDADYTDVNYITTWLTLTWPLTNFISYNLCSSAFRTRSKEILTTPITGLSNFILSTYDVTCKSIRSVLTAALHSARLHLSRNTEISDTVTGISWQQRSKHPEEL